MLGLRFCARAFSSCGKWGPLFIAVRGPLTIAAPPIAEHRLQTRRLSNCGSRAQLLRGMWDLPRPGLEPVSPALAGRLSTTVPPGKPSKDILSETILIAAPSMLAAHRVITIPFLMVFGLYLASAPWKLAAGRTTVAIKKGNLGELLGGPVLGDPRFQYGKPRSQKKEKKVILVCEHRQSWGEEQSQATCPRYLSVWGVGVGALPVSLLFFLFSPGSWVTRGWAPASLQRLTQAWPKFFSLAFFSLQL